MKKTIIVALMGIVALSASAQQVNTLYFLENAPMRHTINPAFMPVSDGYVNFTPLGWMSFGFGNNSLTLSDVLQTHVDPLTGEVKTIIAPLYPSDDPSRPDMRRQAFLKCLRNNIYVNGDVTLGLVNFGFRVKDFGYAHFGVNERIEMGMTMPKSMFEFLFDGGLTDDRTSILLSGLGLGATAYTEIALGYTHILNEQWTVGGKLKILLGTMYGGMTFNKFLINASQERWNVDGNINIDAAGPMNVEYLASYFDGKTALEVANELQNRPFTTDSLINYKNIPALLKPAGGGLAFDLGFTYKPLDFLQVNAAITDLGFIHWSNGTRFQCDVDSSTVRFDGIGEIDYGDPAYRDADGNFSTEMLMDSVKTRMMGMLDGIGFERTKRGITRMPSARLNVGVDANFWDNRVGVGIVSATRLYNARLYEELTIGAAFRPFNWLSVALSYSLINNGKFSNIGAGLSIMPYDGINMTLALDYIPTSYAGLSDGQGGKMFLIPDKTKMINLALGFSVVWGTNKKDSDKDGVWDKLDVCPGTPRGVAVYPDGCPVDSDGDGVPDYMDDCPDTPSEHYGHVDSHGCVPDADTDGIADYMDKCSDTPVEAFGFLDEDGCPKDTDGDGVPDYLDKCPGTPKEAYGTVDENGCPKDTDGDGVPDYLDKCPGTPPEAYSQIDEHGCATDTDGDGVEDYKDECPGTPKEAYGKVDAKGCPADTDGDGVVDYLDECPLVPGLVENKGCPEVKREVRQLLQKAMQGIEFETGKSVIKKKSYPLLDQIANIFIENTNYIIEVQGHTDNTGSYELNERLSNDRANAVRDYMIGKGVPFERMTAKGYGPDVPIADNKTAAGRQKNRRVEFKITFEEVHVETILDRADPKPAENTAE